MTDYEPTLLDMLRGQLYHIESCMADELKAQASVSAERSDNVNIYKDINTRVEFLYAITVNPDPFCKMNKKMYKNYNHDQQMNMLRRIEAFFVNKHKCKRKKLVYEVCPRSNQIHYHALYEMNNTVALLMKGYIDDRCRRINGPSWRAFDMKEVYDEQGWINYISKSL